VPRPDGTFPPTRRVRRPDARTVRPGPRKDQTARACRLFPRQRFAASGFFFRNRQGAFGDTRRRGR